MSEIDKKEALEIVKAVIEDFDNAKIFYDEGDEELKIKPHWVVQIEENGGFNRDQISAIAKIAKQHHLNFVIENNCAEFLED